MLMKINYRIIENFAIACSVCSSLAIFASPPVSQDAWKRWAENPVNLTLGIQGTIKAQTNTVCSVSIRGASTNVAGGGCGVYTTNLFNLSSFLKAGLVAQLVVA